MKNLTRKSHHCVSFLSGIHLRFLTMPFWVFVNQLTIIVTSGRSYRFLVISLYYGENVSYQRTQLGAHSGDRTQDLSLLALLGGYI